MFNLLVFSPILDPSCENSSSSFISKIQINPKNREDIEKSRTFLKHEEVLRRSWYHGSLEEECKDEKEIEDALVLLGDYFGD